MIVMVILTVMGMVMRSDSYGKGDSDSDGMVMRDDSHGEGDSDGYEYAR